MSPAGPQPALPADALFLGIDGGGTGCRARLEGADGRVLGEGRAGPATLRLGPERSLAAVLEAASAALDAAGLLAEAPRVRACAGLAGLSRTGAREGLAALPHPFASLAFAWDAETACLGAHGGADGGIVIVGTGSCAFARVGGKRLRFGGYGLPASDEGSGAFIGLRALARAIRRLDGRLGGSAMADAIFAVLPRDEAAIVDWMDRASATDYAALAPLVLDAARAGDGEALAVMADAAGGIADLAAALVRAGAPHVSLIGGLAAAIAPFLDADTRACLRPPLGDPIAGALFLAGQPAVARAGAAR